MGAGYLSPMPTESSPDNEQLDIEQLEERARKLIGSGNEYDGVRSALDQLVADRTNGEPLDTAATRLRAVLDRADRDAS